MDFHPMMLVAARNPGRRPYCKAKAETKTPLGSEGWNWWIKGLMLTPCMPAEL